MPIGNIDYDRGVIINSHPQTGMDVFMYVDKPGYYLTAHGQIVPDAIAREAGYPVDKLSKDKLRQERKEMALAAIDKELNDETEVKEDVVEDRNGLKLISIGSGRHHITDNEGNRLTSTVLPLETAKKVFDKMVMAQKKT